MTQRPTSSKELAEVQDQKLPNVWRNECPEELQKCTPDWLGIKLTKFEKPQKKVWNYK